MTRTDICVLLSLVSAILLAGCSGSKPLEFAEPGANHAGPGNSPGQQDAGWPATLPLDALQPWEELNQDGHVVKGAEAHVASAINGDSEFLAGVERFGEGGNVADYREASSLTSTSGLISHALYRFPLAGDEPGVVSVDVNLTAGNGYFVGLADYSSGAWDWRGPFTDNHVRISAALAAIADGANYTSTLGSVFVSVVAFDGAACDVVGIGVNPLDPADTTAPASPDAPMVIATNGGLLLEWLPVMAEDLAGYRVYHSNQLFDDGIEPGVRVEDGLEGLTFRPLDGLTETTYVRISAVDISGNESALSDIVSSTPLAGSTSAITASVSSPSGSLGETITITASGAETYDFDTDGDGVYDITADGSGIASVDTTALGIIRAAVRGTSNGGAAMARGGVSVIVTSNSRPVAVAAATPASGATPLPVTFTGVESTDFDGSIVGGGWDFDGDGIYEVWDDTDIVHVAGANNTYTVPGVYNAKLRVLDDLGAWDVDTVTIVVSGSSTNIPPVAILGAASSTFVIPDDNTDEFTLDASDSYDPEGGALNFEFDAEGTGVFVDNGADPMYAHVYTNGAYYLAAVRVTDPDGAVSIGQMQVRIRAPHRIALATDIGTGNRKTDMILHRDRLVVAMLTSNGEIVVVHATDESGENWSDPIVVVSGLSSGSTLAMAGHVFWPGILFHDPVTEELRFIRAKDFVGAAWNTTSFMVLDGLTAEMEICATTIGNKIGASFNSGTDLDHDLHYVYAQNNDADTWTSLTVDSNGDTGLYSQLRYIFLGGGDSLPAIVYYDKTNSQLKYTMGLDFSGASWGSIQVLETGVQLIEGMDLQVVDGFPAIAYYDVNSPTGLYFQRATEIAGTAAWSDRVMIRDGSPKPSAMATWDGIPVVAYKFNNAVMNMMFADTADGSSWTREIYIDINSGTGKTYCEAMLYGDSLGIVYRAANDQMYLTFKP